MQYSTIVFHIRSNEFEECSLFSRRFWSIRHGLQHHENVFSETSCFRAEDNLQPRKLKIYLLGSHVNSEQVNNDSRCAANLMWQFLSDRLYCASWTAIFLDSIVSVRSKWIKSTTYGMHWKLYRFGRFGRLLCNYIRIQGVFQKTIQTIPTIQNRSQFNMFSISKDDINIFSNISFLRCGIFSDWKIKIIIHYITPHIIAKKNSDQ